MKKRVALLLSAGLILSLAACDGKSGGNAAAPESAVESESPRETSELTNERVIEEA